MADRFAKSAQGFSDVSSTRRLLSDLSSGAKLESAGKVRIDQTDKMIKSAESLNLANTPDLGALSTISRVHDRIEFKYRAAL